MTMRNVRNDFYRKWCLTVLNFEFDIIKRQRSLYPPSTMDVSERLSLLEGEFCRLKDEVEKAYKDKNIRKLKLFFLSVNEMVMDLDDVLKRELNEKLQQCCGRDLNVYDRKLHNKVENIINRGKIRSDNEYRQVKLYLDCLNPEDKNIQLIDLLDTLMSEYEMLKSK